VERQNMIEVVITGVGLLHPHGAQFNALETALMRKTPPAGPRIERFRFKDFFPKSSKRIKKMDMVSKFASCAALFALEHAGLKAPPSPERTGLSTGTMFGGMEACAAFHEDLILRGPDNVNPVNFPNTSHNVPCGHVAIALGIRGPVTALASGLGAGHEAVLTGVRTIRSGRADMMLVGGYDRWFPKLAEALDDLVPYPAEGSCFLVLESAESAEKRDARILGRILGYGQASDTVPLGRVASNGEGLARALRLALRSCQLETPTSLVLGLTGLEGYDKAIEAAYREVLGESSQTIPRQTPKRVLGETFGAGGCFSVAATLVWMQQGVLPSGPALLDGYAWGGAATTLVVAP
jgi:3-oxoacyl-[acyl-carrier-protein] synthase II